MKKSESQDTKPYYHLKATLAIAKASLRSIMRSPSAVIFTLAFPLIFILVFGFLGNNGVKIEIGLLPNTDRDNPIIHAIQQESIFKIVDHKSEAELKKLLQKGNIAALLEVHENQSNNPKYRVDAHFSTAEEDKGNIARLALNNMIAGVNQKDLKPQVAELKTSVIEGRKYRSIDFILPGQLGFALLSTGVFGTAFVFLSLRQTLVIKRLFATPVSRTSIVLGECLARVGFSLFGALFIIVLGHYFFQFTLINGLSTILSMLLLSALGVVVFMGFGFVVSGIAKNESTIPPISNIITLPQFLLSGTFFPIENFPAWLQPISRMMPLTYLNDALRKIAFEGAALWDVKQQILILIIWGIVIYAVAVKTFKWE